MWQHVIDRPDRSAEIGRLLADVQLCAVRARPAGDASEPARPAASARSGGRRRRRRLARRGRSTCCRREHGAPRLCHGDLHPSNVILGRDGPMIVDWFDASRGDPVADVARSSLTLLGDGAARLRPPAGLRSRPRSACLTEAYLARLRMPLDITDELLARWQAINAVARLAEGVPRGPLLEVWRRSRPGARLPQAGASWTTAQQLVEDAGRRGDHEVVVLRTRQLDARPGLLGDQRARGAIPDLGVALEVPVDARARHPAELERGRAEAAQVARAREQPVCDLALERAPLGPIREAGGHERVGKRRARRDRDRLRRRAARRRRGGPRTARRAARRPPRPPRPRRRPPRRCSRRRAGRRRGS